MKLTELGMLTHSHYKILFVLDKSVMFRITSTQHRVPRKHHVKPLSLIWHKLPHFSPANTVHIDDLARNFAFNPQSGLRIKAYKNSPVTRAHDRELLYLERYLTLISSLDDFSKLDHSQWLQYLEERGHTTQRMDSEFAQSGQPNT
jgi:ubiquitin-like domain-containing CTD phosphatase 1